MTLLKVEELSISFGGISALNSISFELDKGEICSIIGPNGSGKTTIFNCINGIYSPQRGENTKRPGSNHRWPQACDGASGPFGTRNHLFCRLSLASVSQLLCIRTPYRLCDGITHPCSARKWARLLG